MPSYDSDSYTSAASAFEERARRKEQQAYFLRAIFIVIAGLASACLIAIGGYLAVYTPNQVINFYLISLFVGSGVFLLLFSGMIVLLRVGIDDQKKLP